LSTKWAVCNKGSDSRQDGIVCSLLTTLDKKVLSGMLTSDVTHSDPSLFNNNDVKLVKLQSDSGMKDLKQLLEAKNIFRLGNT